jgi:hypothetical protein
MAMQEIPQELVTELLGKSRTRGEYAQVLRAFWESDAQGWEIDLENGPLAGKKIQTVKTGFDNARTHKNAPEGAEDGIRVVPHEGKIFLLRTQAAAA